jgi:uncharacterized protein (DUF362 family)/Pyruvate/2-oxoacid:ferredoxin oxidoreductase delta subunit
MPRVSIARCAQYEPDQLSAAIDAALSPIGGMAAFVSPGQRVLLKVNLLSRATPERAVTTHPEFVRAVIRSVKSAGGIVTVGDSPGGRNAASGAVRRLWQDTGIGSVCEDEGVDLVLFDDARCRQGSADGKLYTSFTLGRAVVDTDVLISLPKLKTHGFMMFTGAVKNLFGCIPGLEKAQFHLKVPDRHDFADMLLDLMLACSPTLAIMDAVVGMEGEGPAGGTPRQIGAVLASADCVALDVIASAMAGFQPGEVYTNAAAARRGLGPASPDDVEVLGEDWRSLAPAGFALPVRDLTAKLPQWLARRLRNWATPKPVLARAHLCTRCAKCEVNCPVGAVDVQSSGPRFDHSRCIRCYCCQELCPEQAIGLSTPPPMARLLSRKA